MAGRDLAEVRAEVEGVVASCERLLQELAQDLRERISERENALKFLSQTRGELERLQAEERQVIERLLGPAPQYDAIAIFFNKEVQAEIDERREKLESARNTNEELRALTQRLNDARIREASARQDVADADFDVEYERTLARQMAALIRDDALARVKDIATADGAPSDNKELRGILSEAEDGIRTATHYVIRMFAPWSPPTPDEISKARAEAQDELPHFRKAVLGAAEE